MSILKSDSSNISRICCCFCSSLSSFSYVWGFLGVLHSFLWVEHECMWLRWGALCPESLSPEEVLTAGCVYLGGHIGTWADNLTLGMQSCGLFHSFPVLLFLLCIFPGDPGLPHTWLLSQILAALPGILTSSLGRLHPLVRA